MSPETTTTITLPPGVESVGDLKIPAKEFSTERKHRHKMEVRRFWVEDAPVHVTAIGIGIVVLGTAVAIVLAFRLSSSVDERKSAISKLTHLLSAVAGFAFGKKAAK